MAVLPVEGSWRMVDGEHDSFETSVVPNDDVDPFLSSGQPSQSSTIDAGAGGSGSGSGGNSQEDDIQAFLRKAEEDERVLLRSPFQPSVPSSVRESPMSNAGNIDNSVDQTPEPEFHMPSVEVASASSLRERQPFVNRTGSPAQRSRRAGRRGSPVTASTATGTTETTPTPESWASSARPTAAAWQWSQFAQISHFLLLPALLGAVVVVVASVLAWSASAGSTAALAPVCSLPGVVWLDLAVCRAADETTAPQNDDTDGTEKPEFIDFHDRTIRFTRHSGGLKDDARELMRVQTQLAVVVRDRVVAGAASSGAAAQEAWLVPRAQLKDLRLALEMQQSRESKEERRSSTDTNDSSQPSQPSADALLLLEVDEYFEAIKDVSMALARLQTGAAAASADTLAHVSQRTLAQLRRIWAGWQKVGPKGPKGPEGTDGADGADDAVTQELENEPEPQRGWLARLFGSGSSSASSLVADRLALVDAYRRHAEVLAAKTGDRVGEAKDVLTALEAAGVYLETMEAMVDGRRDELTGEARGGREEEEGATEASPKSLLWFRKLFQGVTRSTADRRSKARQQWEEYAAQLRVVREQHDAMTARTNEALVELTALRSTLQQLLEQLAKGVETGRQRILEVGLHMAIVEASIDELARI